MSYLLDNQKFFSSKGMKINPFSEADSEESYREMDDHKLCVFTMNEW